MVVPFVRGLQFHPLSKQRLLASAMLKVLDTSASIGVRYGPAPTHAGVSLQDFVVYNMETNRLAYNALVSKADLRQTFLPAFEAGVKLGEVKSVMTSYHAMNGVPETAFPLIQTELRGRLGWDGVMVSDGGAVTDILNFKYLKNLSMTDNITAAAAAALNVR